MKTTQVQRLVYKMLTENTGSHILDSGGAYGRHWERNQKKTIKDFIREPEEEILFDVKNKEIYRNVSVFHYLSGLDLDDICNKFNRRNTNPGDWDGGDDEVYGVSNRAWNWLTENYEVNIKYTVNTYNHESDLSQVLQYSVIEIDDEIYFVMQVHGGCDIRGGYSDAKLFKADTWADERIHEYLWDYRCSDEIIEGMREGYVDDIRDYWDNDKIYPKDVVLKLINGDGVIDDVDQQFIDNLDKFELDFGYDKILVDEAKEKATAIGGEWYEHLSENFKIEKLESIGFINTETLV